MSISTEISRLQSAKNTLKTKLNAKNDNEHQITNETIDQYGNFVDSIQVGKLTNAEYTEADNDVDDILENTVVPSGTISITANGEYDVTNYTDANVNVISEYNAKILTNMTSSDLSSAAYWFTELPVIDCSQITNSASMFIWMKNLTKIGGLTNTSNITTMQNMFFQCQSLVHIPIFDVSSITIMQNAFTSCNSLSNESLNNILYMLANATSYTATKTLQFIGLSSTQATTCTGLSNWASAQQAGWTTGY